MADRYQIYGRQSPDKWQIDTRYMADRYQIHGRQIPDIWQIDQAIWQIDARYGRQISKFEMLTIMLQIY